MEGSSSAKSDTEYAAQYFGFLPSSFVDDLSEDSIDLVTNALGAMKQQIMKKLAGQFDQKELDESFKKVEDKYQMNQEKIFEKLGSYLCAHILKVPNHVLLPEDEAWDGETSAGAASKLLSVNTEMASMRESIKTALYKKAVLATELDNIKEVCRKQEIVIEKDKELFKKHSVEDCKDLIDFTIQNQKSLGNKSKELESVMGNVIGQEDKLEHLDCIVTKSKKHKNESNLDNYVKRMKTGNSLCTN
eukprot:GFUD01003367.1.p1 GENE.GFUD01003367.1~~GFUD01003367.1.p1  ORF type:complete len:263 (-),score=87.78 GFUD01003367.1:84-821(-)